MSRALLATPVELAWVLGSRFIVQFEEVGRVPLLGIKVEVRLRALVPVVVIRHEKDPVVALLPTSFLLQRIGPEVTEIRPVPKVELGAVRILHLDETLTVL